MLKHSVSEVRQMEKRKTAGEAKPAVARRLSQEELSARRSEGLSRVLRTCKIGTQVIFVWQDLLRAAYSTKGTNNRQAVWAGGAGTQRPVRRRSEESVNKMSTLVEEDSETGWRKHSGCDS
nr:hypothetical protein L204_02024 [Cryptococcus depauperatus CBS 7855]